MTVPGLRVPRTETPEAPPAGGKPRNRRFFRTCARLLALAAVCGLPVLPSACSKRSADDADETIRLIRDLQDMAPEIRLRAIGSLGALRDRRAARPLVRCLRDIRSDVRRAAVEALGLIADPASVGPLCGVLESPENDAELRRLAADALGAIADASAVPALAAALHDADENVAFSAAYALGRIGEPSLDALIKTLESGSPRTRTAVASVLGQIPSDRSRLALRPYLTNSEPMVRLAAAETLAALSDAASAPAIVALIRDPDNTVRKGIPRVVRKLGIAAAQPLGALLEAGANAVEQDVAVDALVELREPPAVRPLLLAVSRYRGRPSETAEKHLQNLLSKEPCRAELLRIGAQSQPAEQVTIIRLFTQFLGSRFSGRNPSVPLDRTFAAAGMPDLTSVVSFFAQSVKNADPAVRLRAAMSLCSFGDPRGKDVLVQALRNAMQEMARPATGNGRSDGTVRNRLADYLEALAPVADTALADEVLPLLRPADSSMREVSGAVIRILARTRDPRFVDVLGPLAGSGQRSHGLELAAATALGAIGDKRGFDPVLKYFNLFENRNYHAEIRLAILRNLFLCDAGRAHDVAGRAMIEAKAHDTRQIEGIAHLYTEFPDLRAVTPLMRWVSHDLQTARDAVQRALPKVAGNDPKRLVDAFEVETHAQRSAVAGVLADAFGAKALPALQQAAADPRPRTRQGAIWAFGCIGGPEAVAAVRAALADPHAAVRSAAAWSVGRMKDPALAVSLVPLLKDPDDDVRSMAAEQLGLFAESRAVDPLIAALSDTNSAVRGYAALSLGKMHATNALPALRELAQDPHPDVRTAADTAVHTLAGPATRSAMKAD